MYRSYSKLLAYEISRILFRLGCDVRIYDPTGLPVKDDVQHEHAKVMELRSLSRWSDGHFWVSPEQHGNLVRILPNHTGFSGSPSDRGFQKPDRLDTPQHWFRKTNTGQDFGAGNGLWWITIL